MISIPNESLRHFVSFFDIMRGFSFWLDDVDFSSFNLLIDSFQINYLYKFISSKVPFPHTLDEAIQFLSKSYSKFLKEQFNQSLSIVVQNFNFLSFDALNQFSNSLLFTILSSELLQVKNEDYLFDLIVKMIEEDKNRMILLKSVHFEFVSSHSLKKFFENIHNDEIDFELFELLKKRLLTDYSDQEILKNRWRMNPKVLSELEIEELFNIFNSFFQQEQNPIEQAKLLIKENEWLKKENEKIESLQNQILQLEKINEEIRHSTISYRNNHNGILQDLRKSGPNPFLISSSGTFNQQPFRQPKIF
jgi:hypothetical protein